MRLSEDQYKTIRPSMLVQRGNVRLTNSGAGDVYDVGLADISFDTCESCAITGITGGVSFASLSDDDKNLTGSSDPTIVAETLPIGGVVMVDVECVRLDSGLKIDILASAFLTADGYRWLAMLESGEVKSMKELARREGVDDSYVSRMVNMTTLAPDIVAAILDETLPEEVTLLDLAAVTLLVWEDQWGWVGGNRLARR
jgi:hypothetical protein